jgi:hypothetical protein
MADTPSNRAPETAASQSTRQMLDDLDVLMQRMLALPVQTPDEEVQPPGPEDRERRSVDSNQQPTDSTSDSCPRSSVLCPAPAAAQFPVHPPAVTVQAPLPGAAQEVFVGRPLAPERAPVLRPAHEEISEPTVGAPTYLPVGAEGLLPVILHRPLTPTPLAGGETGRSEGTKKAAGGQKAEGSGPKPEGRRQKAEGSEDKGQRSALCPLPSGSWGMRLLIYINRSFDRFTPWLGGAGRWLRSADGRTVLGWTGVAMFAVALIWAALRFLV